MPPLLVVLKSFSSFIGAVIGYLGYRMVQVFYKQLQEPRGSSLPTFACLGISADCRDNKKCTGSPKPRLKQTRHFIPHRIRRQLPALAGDLLRLRKTPAQQRHFRPTRHRIGASCSGAKLSYRRAGSCTREGVRHYWTRIDSFTPLFFQAAKRRLTLWKDDMLLYVTKIGKSLP